MRYTHLSMQERIQIETLRAAGASLGQIAHDLPGRASSTISRELRRHRTGQRYAAPAAQALADRRRATAPRPRRLDDVRLARYVRRRWEQDLAPEQSVGTWTSRQPRVSVATIYAWLYRSEPWWRPHLRQGFSRRRRSYRRRSHYQRIRGAKPLERRPACVAARRRVSDFECDTVRGRDQQAGLLTWVNPRTGYLSLAWVPDRRASSYNAAGLAACRRHGLRSTTLTQDNGMEFAQFRELERALHCRVYFAHPPCAWERGCNENLNGLLRQYFPKHRDFRTITAAEVRRVEARLNRRPRKRLDYRTPAKLMAQAVALQA